MRKSVPVLAAAACLVAVAACASSETDSPFQAAPDASQSVRLTVENNNPKDAAIYANWGGRRNRVGMVTGKTTRTFEMRWRYEEVRLEVDFVAGTGFVSEPIAVYGGDHLNFVIQVWR